MGHRVSVDGVRCDPAKLEAVSKWPRPETCAEVRSFLGLANYYKRFVPKFSKVALPLVNLTCKSVVFSWNESCVESFVKLKELFTTAPTLAYPSQSPEAHFILDTDASEYALGAVLSQVHEGEERVLAYASKALTHSQRNYCTTYRELLAIVEFVPHFKHYLLGRKFVIRTDHSSLRWFLNFKNAEGLVGRWHAILANYEYDLVHRVGADHRNAEIRVQTVVGREGMDLLGLMHLAAALVVVLQAQSLACCLPVLVCATPCSPRTEVEAAQRRH